jgi:organic radical activating enzyme
VILKRERGNFMKGFVREIFTSMQGEGIKVGQRQTFIRFLGCNLACRYCDTPETKRMVGPFIHQTKKFRNPIDAPEVAITGGEPLLQPAFLEILCKELKNKSKKIYLDSNGTLPDALAKVIKYIDTVALDFKIPTATCGPKLWQKHRECLRIAATKEVFVKIVINEKVLPQELYPW